ncbi:selenoprotein E precursor [Silurus meridionalis]|nr:selenoprotein E precursor [Silurus meridionalis]
MWFSLLVLLALCATGKTEENTTQTPAVKEKLIIARGKLFIVPVKKMKADEICELLDSLGFYKKSQKGEDIPEEFKNFPLHAQRDEL